MTIHLEKEKFLLKIWCKFIGHSYFYLFFWLLGLYSRHMEVPRLGVESELQLPAYATATATPDPSCVCDLHHSLRQCSILNPLGKDRDQTRILRETTSGP